MINQGWTWTDLQTLTFPQLNLFADKMAERNERLRRELNQ